MTKVIHWKTLPWYSHILYEPSDWVVLSTKHFRPFNSWKKTSFVTSAHSEESIKLDHQIIISHAFMFPFSNLSFLVHYMIPPTSPPSLGIEKNTILWITKGKSSISLTVRATTQGDAAGFPQEMFWILLPYSCHHHHPAPWLLERASFSFQSELFLPVSCLWALPMPQVHNSTPEIPLVLRILMPSLH